MIHREAYHSHRTSIGADVTGSGIIFGSSFLEQALEPFSLVEFYGEWTAVLDYVHWVVDANSHTHILLVYVQLFGGLDGYTLRGDALRVTRCFDVKSTAEAIRRVPLPAEGDADASGMGPVFVVDPYLHAKEGRDYFDVTAALRSLSATRRVIVFNRDKKSGAPLGGPYHASTMQVLVRIERVGRGLRNVGVRGRGHISGGCGVGAEYLATLVKHPAHPSTKRYLVHAGDVSLGASLAYSASAGGGGGDMGDRCLLRWINSSQH